MREETRMVYVAADGMEFNSSQDCENYEKELIGGVLMAPIDFPVQCWRGDVFAWCAIIRSKEEYDAMIQHLIDEKYVNNMYDWHGGELEYPWKGIVVTDDIGCGGLYDLKNIMRDMVKANETLENVYGKGE